MREKSRNMSDHILHISFILVFLVLCAVAQARENDVAFYRSLVYMVGWSVYTVVYLHGREGKHDRVKHNV